MGINAIVDGHVREALGLNNDMALKRLEICKMCPLYKKTSIVGAICNNKLWVNPDTGYTSLTKQIGYKRGCGCRLSAKTRVASSKCPLNKW